MSRDIKAAIAVTRFGLGAKRGEIRNARSDPRGYLLAQLRNPNAALINAATLGSSKSALQDYFGSQQLFRIMKTDGKKLEIAGMRKQRNRQAVLAFRADIDARMHRAVQTDDSFLERWVRFWSNHFSVSARQARLYGLVGAFEREAIRPHVLGSFHDMAIASSFHPAMQMYLDNYRSIGPKSLSGRSNKRGLNENLAREILELHTMGVGGGYSQADIESFAKALTGWTIEIKSGKSKFGQMVFRSRWHEPGAKVFLGRRYDDVGVEQAGRMIGYACAHPSTARHVATKLVRHFVSDAPDERDIAVLAKVFMDTGGNLKSLAKAVVRLDSAWTGEREKFKSPDDWVVSVGRLLGYKPTLSGEISSVMKTLGQPPLRAPSPQGYPDIASDWIGADAIKKRLEWANRTARRAGSAVDVQAFLQEALGPFARDETRLAISRAESVAQGLTLALMSPEFQRR